MVVTLHLFFGCTLISPNRHQEKINLAGTVSGMFQTPLPLDAKLHVLLHKNNPTSGEYKVIANQAIDVSTVKFPIPFSLGLEATMTIPIHSKHVLQ